MRRKQAFLDTVFIGGQIPQRNAMVRLRVELRTMGGYCDPFYTTQIEVCHP
jgi:hypothetical protein